MIVLFTDFGMSGPYLGQMKAVLYREAPGVPVIDLFSNAPTFDSKLAAYLLAAYVSEFPLDSVFLCVIDPGVGGPRAPVIVRADGRWFVGPDNGLFNVIAKRARRAQCWDIRYPATKSEGDAAEDRQTPRISASFHGRDIFAPVAARLARHEAVTTVGQLRGHLSLPDDWPEDLARIVYIDHYGNALTGLRANGLDKNRALCVNGHCVTSARTFCEVPEGQGFWYENSNGLAEIAVNRGRAERQLGLSIGEDVVIR